MRRSPQWPHENAPVRWGSARFRAAWLYPAAFSLVELLSVMAVISVMASLTVTALPDLLGARASANGANLVADLLLSARQQAIATGHPIAVVFASRTNPESKQGVILLEGKRQGTTVNWEPSTRWQQIGEGVDVAPLKRDDRECLYESREANLLSQIQPPLNGQAISTYFYLIYRPDGSIDAPQVAPGVTIRRQNKQTSNDYVVVAQENTGRIKIVAD